MIRSKCIFALPIERLIAPRTLREDSELSLKNPPQRVTLKLEGCPTDANGFCPMDDFNRVADAAIKP
ncbi:MAG: hypothetical protein ACFNTM_02750 [Cardiobacterium sp.]